MRKVVLIEGTKHLFPSKHRAVSAIRRFAAEIGQRIMQEPDWILLNGGRSEVSKCASMGALLETTIRAEDPKKRILELCVEASHGIGRVESVRGNYDARRQELANRCHVMIAIGGEQNFKHLIEHVKRAKKPILPIPGACRRSENVCELWKRDQDEIRNCFSMNEADVAILTKRLSNADELAQTVMKLVKRAPPRWRWV